NRDMDGRALRSYGRGDGCLAADMGMPADDGGDLGEGKDTVAQSEVAKVGVARAPAGIAGLATHLLLDERYMGDHEDSCDGRIVLDASEPLTQSVSEALGEIDIAPGPVYKLSVHIVAALLGSIPGCWHGWQSSVGGGVIVPGEAGNYCEVVAAPLVAFEPVHTCGAGQSRQLILEEILTGAAARPDIVVTSDNAYLAGQVLKERQTVGEVLYALSDIASEHRELRLFGGDARDQRPYLILAGDTEVKVAGDDDACHTLHPLVCLQRDPVLSDHASLLPARQALRALSMAVAPAQMLGQLFSSVRRSPMGGYMHPIHRRHLSHRRWHGPGLASGSSPGQRCPAPSWHVASESPPDPSQAGLSALVRCRGCRASIVPALWRSRLLSDSQCRGPTPSPGSRF